MGSTLSGTDVPRFKVLFVGYSHNDVVMTPYMARGLSPASHRGSFSPMTRILYKWEQLGVVPIECMRATDGRAWTRLLRAVEVWGTRSIVVIRLDHRQLVADLLKTAPSQRPDEESYLRERRVGPDVCVESITEFALRSRVA